MLIFMLALTIAAALLSLQAAAKHATCYWTGPGSGDPTNYGFSQFCEAHPYPIIYNGTQPPRTGVAWLCNEYANHPRVADWILRDKVLEFSTPCNNGGYSGDCSYGLWSMRLRGFKDPATGEKEPPTRFWRKWDDCEWSGELAEEQLPQYIQIYHK